MNEQSEAARMNGTGPSAGWVAVADRKPEIGQLCWIMVRPGKPELGQCGDGLFHDKNRWICAPTHWHPLVPPDPPNAGNQGQTPQGENHE